MRTKPHPKPILISGLLRDLQAKDNLTNEPLPPGAPGASWFRVEKDVSTVKTPQPLASTEVGPDAAETP